MADLYLFKEQRVNVTPHTGAFDGLVAEVFQITYVALGFSTVVDNEKVGQCTVSLLLKATVMQNHMDMQ